jgi:Tol biopolymer transport system component
MSIYARTSYWPGTPVALAICGLVVGCGSAAAARHERAAANAQPVGVIAFNRIASNGQKDIFTINPAGGHARQITHTPKGQGGSEAPAWSSAARRIYFDSDRAGSIHAFSMHADGRGVRQLTRGTGEEASPRESPNGKLLAYEHDAANHGNGGIYVAPIHNGTLGRARQLTHSPALRRGGFDTQPEFSPDGSTLAFLRILSPRRPRARSALFVIGVNGRGLAQLTPYSLNAIGTHWSPDGTRLLFSSNSDNFSATLSANVYVVGADGSHMTQLTHDASGAQSFTPDWSPNATRIVFAHAAAASGADLRVLDLQTGGITVIRHSARGTRDQDPDWTAEP